MSKGLEMLEILKQRNGNLKVNHKIGSRDIANQEIKEITQCFDNYVIPVIEKELKALEIIKNKRVDVFELLLGISNSVYRNPLERYNSYVEGSFNTELTQEEFNVLEDVLGEWINIICMQSKKNI